MKFNVFRNPFVVAKINMLLSSFDDGTRNQTEEYWRQKISEEIIAYATRVGYENLNLGQLSTIFNISNDVRKGNK